MNLLPHWGDCNRQIEKLRLDLADAQAQNIAYMRDLNDLTCRLRMASLKKPECSDCKSDKEIMVENSLASDHETVVR